MANDNESDVKTAALKAHNRIIRDETKVLAKALTGEVSDHEAVNQVLGIIDGPQRREADRLFEAATGERAVPDDEWADERAELEQQIAERPSRRAEVDPALRRAS